MNQLYLQERIRSLTEKIKTEKDPVKKLIYKEHLERLQAELDKNILIKMAKERILDIE